MNAALFILTTTPFTAYYTVRPQHPRRSQQTGKSEDKPRTGLLYHTILILSLLICLAVIFRLLYLRHSFSDNAYTM